MRIGGNDEYISYNTYNHRNNTFYLCFILDGSYKMSSILDKYTCENCGGILRRRIEACNIECESPILFCPFCGSEYNEKT